MDIVTKDRTYSVDVGQPVRFGYPSFFGEVTGWVQGAENGSITIEFGSGHARQYDCSKIQNLKIIPPWKPPE